MQIPFTFSSDEQRNKWLLYHFLKKSYTDIGIPEDKADELTENKIIKNSKNLFDFHGLAWQLGQFSLEFFCMYFLQDIYLPKEDNAAAPLAPVHEELWKDIQESIRSLKNLGIKIIGLVITKAYKEKKDEYYYYSSEK